jgi:hypothetical protein
MAYLSRFRGGSDVGDMIGGDIFIAFFPPSLAEDGCVAACEINSTSSWFNAKSRILLSRGAVFFGWRGMNSSFYEETSGLLDEVELLL